ncbi:hypothetical protein SprV_0100016400 [Sparganum proliferum]
MSTAWIPEHSGIRGSKHRAWGCHPSPCGGPTPSACHNAGPLASVCTCAPGLPGVLPLGIPTGQSDSRPSQACPDLRRFDACPSDTWDAALLASEAPSSGCRLPLVPFIVDLYGIYNSPNWRPSSLSIRDRA